MADEPTHAVVEDHPTDAQSQPESQATDTTTTPTDSATSAKLLTPDATPDDDNTSTEDAAGGDVGEANTEISTNTENQFDQAEGVNISSQEGGTGGGVDATQPTTKATGDILQIKKANDTSQLHDGVGSVSTVASKSSGIHQSSNNEPPGEAAFDDDATAMDLTEEDPMQDMDSSAAIENDNRPDTVTVNDGDAVPLRAEPSPSDDFADFGDREENTGVGTRSVERAPSVTYADNVVQHSFDDAPASRPRTRDTGSSRGINQRKSSTKALDFTWILGFDCHLAGGVHYLADNDREEIFVPAGHVGMLFAHIDHEQALLQGHCHGITATAASVDKRWVATADNGPSCTTIVWDTVTGEPARSWFGNTLDNVGHVAFNTDATLLAALDGPHLDCLSIWDWSAMDVDTPLVTVTLPLAEDTSHTHTATLPSSLAFHPDDPTLVVVTRHTEVYTVRWTPAGTTQTETMHVKGVSHRKLGTFTHSLFLPRTSIAVSTTSGGYVVLWETGSAGTQTRCLKYIEVFDAPITYATMTPDGETFVAGGHDGAVKYFDTQFRLVGWNDQLDCGPITSISFSNAREDTSDGFGRRASLASLGLGAKEVDVPNYLVATTHGRVLLVSTDPEVRAAQELMNFQAADVRAIAPHPHASVLAVAGFGGRLQLWNYSLKTDVVQVELGADKHVTAMCFSPDGEVIVLGYSNGKVSLLDAMSLTELSRKSSFRDLDDVITHLRFAPDGTHFAVATANNHVGLFRRADDRNASARQQSHTTEQQRLDDEERWLFVGKYRSHAARITDVRFGIDRDNHVRLLSIGADRMLVEYDVQNSSFDAGLLLKGVRVHLEQTAFPTTFDWYPRTEDQLEDFLITTTSDYKLKLFNATTKQCRRTTLGPVSGDPVAHLAVMPAYPHADSARIAAFACGPNVGLQLLPVDGNPHKIVVMIGHAAPVTALVHSHDGRYLFSAAGSNVHMMTVNTHVLSAQAALGGSGSEPFVSMLEGGRDGHLYKDMEDYFYYIQLDNQGMDRMETRTVSDRIPLSQVPRIFRALGYYPSEQEIANITNEVKFSKFLETRRHVEDVDIDALVQLFVNHRPAVPLSVDDITAAFATLSGRNTGEVGTSQLLDLLAKHGEFMNDSELAKILGTLLGGRSVADVLSTTTTPDAFTTGVLGF